MKTLFTILLLLTLSGCNFVDAVSAGQSAKWFAIKCDGDIVVTEEVRYDTEYIDRRLIITCRDKK